MAVALLLGAAHASAQATLISGLGGPAGYGSGVLAANDDGSSTVIDLSSAFPAGLNFFGTIQTQLYVNNNGNVTFAGPVGAFTPTAFPVAARPMIAPWWGDVDTRAALAGGQDLVYWSVSTGRFIATWYNVGYFSIHTDRLNAFQLILTDASASGAAGDFDVEFRYNRCQWTTGDASGGSGGLGGTPAQAGFDAGNGVNYQELPGSRTAAILALCATSNVGTTGVWRFQIRSGAITQCGNGIIELGEGCDDRNLVNGDGCNSRCVVELPPGGPCDEDIDCRSGFCTDGVCCNARCGGQCEACALPSSPGTCSPVSGAPVGRPACATDGSACGGTCNGVIRTACVYPGAASACDDGAFCTVSDVCNGAGACSPGPARSCDDGRGCTTDMCNEVTDSCTSTLASGCLIGGACIAAGTPNPANPCLVCNPAVSTMTWSPAAAGTACDDGLFCTAVDGCDGAGGCTGTARDCSDGVPCTLDTCDEVADMCTSMIAASCIIDGMCVADGTANPANPCELCNAAISTSAWSPATAGTACDDGMFCTDVDTCDGAGACTGTARDCSDGVDCTLDTCDETTAACVSTVVETCRIDGACIPDTTVNPDNPCEVCDPARDTAAWSAAALGTSCDDGLFCTESDVCDGSGACGGTARSCDDALDCTTDTCDETAGACSNTLDSGCLIDGACVADGDASPDDACMVCDAETSTSSYTSSDASECVQDASVQVDAGADAGPVAYEVRGSGCGCRVGARSESGAWAILALLALVFVARKRS